MSIKCEHKAEPNRVRKHALTGANFKTDTKIKN